MQRDKDIKAAVGTKQSPLISWMVSLLLALTPLHASAKDFYVVDSVAFYQVTEEQQTPFWCWAASIAMAIKAQGVDWNQFDVVNATKGSLEAATADAGQMTSFLNSWHFSADGSYWTVQSDHYKSMPPISKILKSLDEGRPVIFTFKTGDNMEHAVVLYGALMNWNTSPPKLTFINYFDPISGKRGMLATKFRDSVTNAWLINVSK